MELLLWYGNYDGLDRVSDPNKRVPLLHPKDSPATNGVQPGGKKPK